MMRAIAFCGLLALTPFAASAQSVQEQILTQLSEQGFHDFEVSKTLLGRIRVTSKSNTLRRELVFNPVTGEILRDYWTALTSNSGQNPRVILRDPSRTDSDDSGQSPRNSSDDGTSDHSEDDAIDDRSDNDDDKNEVDKDDKVEQDDEDDDVQDREKDDDEDEDK